MPFLTAEKPRFEAITRPPPEYLEDPKQEVANHPVRDTPSDHARQRIESGNPLKRPTHLNYLTKAKDARGTDPVWTVGELMLCGKISTTPKGSDPTCIFKLQICERYVLGVPSMC